MEIHWEGNVLRITADKSSAEYAVHDITDALEKTEAHTWNLKPWLPFMEREPGKAKISNFFSQKSLQTIGQATGTNIHSITGDEVRHVSSLSRHN